MTSPSWKAPDPSIPKVRFAAVAANEAWIEVFVPPRPVVLTYTSTVLLPFAGTVNWLDQVLKVAVVAPVAAAMLPVLRVFPVDTSRKVVALVVADNVPVIA